MEWYTEVSANEEINQGDIFFKCPILLPDQDYDFSEFDFNDKSSFQKIQMKVYTANIIVLTQSCDIVNNPPLDNIIVGKIDDIVGETHTFLKEVLSNRRPSYHLLNKKDYGNIKINYQIVDFTSLYSIPYRILNHCRQEQSPRLRLNSPYIEQLSQRFGNFFSRVGLPESKGIDKEDLLKNS